MSITGRQLCWLGTGLLLLAGCSQGQAPAAASSELALLLPQDSELAGWTIDHGPAEYAPETLYEYLNGGAERYLNHGFRSLVNVRYRLGDDELACVTLDLYDMGSELGAFGIYSAARPPGVDVRTWGAEGYRVGTVAAAWKGRAYVHGEADDEHPQLIEMLEKLVARVADSAVGDASSPAILALLPVDGLVPRSERYQPADLLGHAFLPGGMMATYEVAGRRAELFVSDLGNEEAADEALAALRDHLSRWGRVDGEAPTTGVGGFRYWDQTLGHGIAVQAGPWVAGVHGELAVEEGERILDQLIAGLH